MRNKASNIARGTLENERTCGDQTADASVSRDIEVRGSVRAPASRATLIFPGGAAFRKARARMCREKENACVEMRSEAGRRLDHPPLEGEGRRSERSELSRGGVKLCCERESPHPDAHCIRVDPPPPGEGGTGRAGAFTDH